MQGVQAISPIQTLPLEIILEIFAFSASPLPNPRFSVDRIKDPPRFETTAMTISHVCSDWRSIAFSTPEVWSWMIVRSPTMRCAELVQYYLFRGGSSAGLHLSFYATSSNTLTPEALQDEACSSTVIFDLWIDQIHRWRSIDFDFSIRRPPNRLLFIAPDDICQLSSARLNLLYLLDPDQKRCHDTVYTSPTLKDIVWNCDLVRTYLPCPALLGQLTSVYIIQTVKLDDFIKLLSSCSRLQHLGIPVESAKGQDTVRPIVVTMHHLMTLHLHWWTTLDSSVQLDQIKAPNLLELEVGIPTEDPTALKRLLSRSRCNLRKLVLFAHRSVFEEHIVRCISTASPHLASLNVFKLSGYFLSAKVTSLFLPSLVGGVMTIPFPQLIDLTLDRCYLVPDGHISNMVNARSRCGVPLWFFECRARYDGRKVAGLPMDSDYFASLKESGVRLFWRVEEL
ncbi:hypothetical protein BDN72DRAFT_956795 [Pluteus cervinus]|uniref:Uncharacterized protein n=1 Tax=Pluteus cervinus TaxID=181527 RepID=A0ACD3B5U5_9AGAR|nr:hypothetical protein BDN72DRAFT_956795 [Pluteus cervinus]